MINKKGFVSVGLILTIVAVGIGGLLLGKRLISQNSLGGPTVLKPFGGGTGTSTTPSAGFLLIGRSDGTGLYDFVASSSIAGSSADGLGVVTSSLGSYAAGNLSFFLSSTTVSASSGLQFTSSTGFLRVLGSLSVSDNINSSSSITRNGVSVSFVSTSSANTWSLVQTLNGGITGTSTFNWGGDVNVSGTSLFFGNLGASGTRIPKGWFSDIDSTIGTIGTLTISSVVSGDLVVNGGNVNLASTTKTYQIGGTTVISSSSVYGVSSTTVKTSSFTMNQYDATTTKPYSYVKTQIPFNITITEISCDEFASASTNTIAIYRATSTANLAIDSVILASLGCGINGTSTTSFTTTTVLAGQFIVASTTATNGTPSWSAINIKFTK